ncbi:MAG: tetratricopeptide repeat protein, partial [Geitlerinemataceae cyanobacterium]
VGKTLELTVTSQEAVGSVQLVGYIPPNIAQGNSFTLEVGWRKKEVCFETPELFKISLAVRALAGKEIPLKIEAKTVVNPKQSGINDDERDISFLLIKLVFSTENEVDYIKRGNQLIREGKVEEAIEAYRYAVELDPDLYWSNYCLGKALSQQGRLEEANDWFGKAESLNRL